CRGGDAQPDGAEGIREHGGLLQIWQIAPLRLIVGVADIVANLDALPGDCASPRHGIPRSNPNFAANDAAGRAAASTQSGRPWSSGSERRVRPAIRHLAMQTARQRLDYAAMLASNSIMPQCSLLMRL